MEDENKTREELIGELKDLREQLSRMQQLDAAAVGKAEETLKTAAQSKDFAITAWAKTEQALKEIEVKFRLFLEYTPIYVFFKDENIRSLHLSRNYEQLLGRPLEELLGKSMEELFPSELARSMVADDRRILREGKPLEVEEEFGGRFYSTLKFPICIDGKPCFLAGFTTDITERKLMEEERARLLAELQEAFEKIKTLRGIIPICASCKKIRNDEGYWQQIEVYLLKHSEAEFSHGLCPECIKQLYPDYDAME